MQIEFSELVKLASVHGESFYLCDTQKFSDNYDQLLQSFKKYYPQTQIAYSYKTNYTPRLCSIVDKKGGYAEVVSEMEYDLAIRIGVSPDKIIVNGPYKTKQNLEKYFSLGSIVNLDSLNELDLTIEIANENIDNLISIGIRCNFNIREGFTSRFGISCESPDFKNIINKTNQISNIRIKGLHCHFPDRDLDSFKVRVDKVLKLLETDFDYQLDYIDIGGGFFGNMPDELKKQFQVNVPDYNDYAEEVASRIFDYFEYKNKKRPQLIIEPGTAIVADVLQFVARVIDIKTIGNKKIAMTTGSKFNLGAFSSTLNFPLTVVSKTNNTKNTELESPVDISGYTCIEGDYLYKGYKGTILKDDFLVFQNVGSYSIVFKPPFIMPNVAVIEINSKNKDYRILKRKEDINDVFRTFSF